MRSRKTWGVLGSFMGMAGSMAALGYFSIALLAMTNPALASSPDCLDIEIDLALAQASQDTYQEIYIDEFEDLEACMLNTGGPCLDEQIDVALALASYETYVEIRQELEADLMMCRMGY